VPAHVPQTNPGAGPVVCMYVSKEMPSSEESPAPSGIETEIQVFTAGVDGDGPRGLGVDDGRGLHWTVEERGALEEDLEGEGLPREVHGRAEAAGVHHDLKRRA